VLLVARTVTDNERRIVAGLSRVLGPAGIGTLLAVHDSPGVGLPAQVERLLQHRTTRAVVMCGGFPPADRAQALAVLRASGVPTLLVNDAAAGLPSVRTDNAAGIRLALAHLVDDCGAQRIAFARGPVYDLDATEREAAFRDDLARRGLQVDEDLIFDGGYQMEPARASFRDVLATGARIDAVLAANDLSASGVVSAAMDAGLKVPGDLCVVGFDDVSMAARALPTLTSVNPSRSCQGAEAARILLSLIERGRTRDQDPEQCLIRPQLAMRATTTGQAGADIDALARLMHSQMAAEGTMLDVNRALLRCESVDEVLAEVAARVEPLGISNLALVLVDDADPTRTADPAARVALLVRDGRAVPPPPASFPASALVPESLRPQLGATLGILHPLTVPDGELGYLLYETPDQDTAITDALAVDLSRGLAGVMSRVRIAAHAAALEAVVDRRTRELQRANASLRLVNAGLKRSLLLDSLTGIANRRAFQQHLHQHWNELADTGAPMSLLMIDVDLFKAFNDHYGHLAGDETLCVIASCLRESVRGSDDLAARYGGEEFAVVLPAAADDVALTVARRFAARLAERAIVHEASPVAPFVTASIGVATVTVGEPGMHGDLLAAADTALYEAKAGGRNRIRIGT
jgi:diguanylate cyclase (GGDEF)-like protein